LSQQIANLEAEVGAKLLIRSNRGVMPTAAGARVYQRGLGILKEVDRIRRSVDQVGEPSGVVSIGLPSSFAAAFAEPLVVAVRARYPKIMLRAIEDWSWNIQQKLEHGLLDCGLVCIDQPPPRLERRPLFRQALFHVQSGRDRRCGQSGPMCWADLAERPLILPPAPNPLRAAIDLQLSRIGIQPSVVSEANSSSAILSLVSAGLGGSVLLWAGRTTRRLCWRPIINPVAALDFGLCTPAAQPQSEEAEAVQDIIVETVLHIVRQSDWAGAVIENSGENAAR